MTYQYRRRDLDEEPPGAPAPAAPPARRLRVSPEDLRALVGRLDREGTQAVFLGAGGVEWRLTASGLWRPAPLRKLCDCVREPRDREPGEDDGPAEDLGPEGQTGRLIAWKVFQAEDLERIYREVRIRQAEPTISYATFREQNPDLPGVGGLGSLIWGGTRRTGRRRRGGPAAGWLAGPSGEAGA